MYAKNASLFLQLSRNCTCSSPGCGINSIKKWEPPCPPYSKVQWEAEVWAGSFEGFFKGVVKLFACCMLLIVDVFFFIPRPYLCMFVLQHTSHGDGRQEVSSRTGRSGARCRNSIASCADEQPHIGNYRLLKTIGKGNFAKVKLARHILTGREVKWRECKQPWIAVGLHILSEWSRPSLWTFSTSYWSYCHWGRKKKSKKKIQFSISDDPKTAPLENGLRFVFLTSPCTSELCSSLLPEFSAKFSIPEKGLNILNKLSVLNKQYNKLNILNKQLNKLAGKIASWCWYTAGLYWRWN